MILRAHFTNNSLEQFGVLLFRKTMMIGEFSEDMCSEQDSNMVKMTEINILWIYVGLKTSGRSRQFYRKPLRKLRNKTCWSMASRLSFLSASNVYATVQ
jgi:hypothetical protein